MYGRTVCCSFLVFFLNLTITSSAKISITDKTNFTTLRLVQIITRHGDRSPILPYRNDIYRDASIYSINGWGELTEIGAKQVYELGAYLRQRYDGFILRKYRKRDFLMLSSDIDRAIMSAEANLAGLYELGPLPRSRDIFKEWQPVPIHTIPQEEDNLINGKAHCPRYLSLFKQYFDSDDFKNFLDENKEFIDYVVEMSGLGDITTNFQEIFQVQDALRCQHLHNLTLPSWVNKTVFERLEHFKALSFVWNTRTDEMKRLKIGPLFQRLVEEMRAKVETANLILDDDDGEEDEIPPYQDPIAYRKMYIYSGHDSTISAILDSLNLFQPPHIPPYASALIFELHKTPGSGDFFVEIFYKNDTTREPYKLDVGAFCDGPSSQCSYEFFSSFVQKFIPSDWKTECQLQSFSTASWSFLPSSFQYPKLSLMRTAPADVLRSGESFDGQNGYSKDVLHPLGITAPGLSAFVLAVIAVTSLLGSAALLSIFFRHNSSTAQVPLHAAYQHLS